MLPSLRALATTVVSVVVAATAVPASAASLATFLLVPGAPGESKDDQHKDWIDVASLGETIVPVKRDTRCETQVMKHLDRASPLLWGLVASGDVLPEVKIDIVTTGLQRVDVFDATLTNVRVRQVTFAQDVGDGTAGETILLVPQSLTVNYHLTDPQGVPTGVVTSSLTCGAK